MDLNELSFGSRQRQSTFIQFAKSREQLIQMEKKLYEKQCESRRRTKIIATIGQKTNSYEMIKKLHQAGANAFLINMAYISSNQLAQLQQYISQTEQEFNTRIPLTTVLKGTLTRIGDLIKPEINLSRGQTYRLIVKKQIVGDNCICSVDDESLHKKVVIGDKLLVDQGQVVFTVTGLENSDQTLQILRQEHDYDEDFQKPLDMKIKSNLPHLNNNQDDQNTNDHSCISNQSGIQQQQHGHNRQNSGQDVELNKYNTKLIQNLKSKKAKIFKVVKCQVDSDCSIKSYKPIFIYQNQSDNYNDKEEEDLKIAEKIQVRKQSYNNLKKQESQQEKKAEETASDSSDKENFLSIKDLNDLTTCQQVDIDQVCLSNVKTVEDVKEVKKMLKKKKNIKIILKVQTKEAVENFEKLIKYVDGIILARSYLVIHFPVEKLYNHIKRIITISHSHMKPIQVSCNILESMVSTMLPTTAEIGEIASLVEQFVDGIILSQETTVGDHPIQTVEVLSRVCLEQETEQIKKLINNPNQRIPVTIQSSSQVNTILNSIIFCVLEAAYRMPAKLVLAFSETGSIILKMSKLRMPCPILAVTPDLPLARNLNALAGVHGSYMNISKNRTEFEELIPQILQQAKEQGLVQQQDFVIVTMFENDLKGSTNTMKILMMP